MNQQWHYAHGKIILFGEHAVVYGVEALAAAIPNAVRARATQTDGVGCIYIPEWSLSVPLTDAHSEELLVKFVHLIFNALGLDKLNEQELKSATSHRSANRGALPFNLRIESDIPAASGLGASAALAVASIRAIAACFDCEITDQQVNALAYQCEQLAHGQPSGLDNSLACFGGIQRFKRAEPGQSIQLSAVRPKASLELLIALSGKKGFTAEAVARVRKQYDADTARYQEIFERIGRLSAMGIDTLEQGRWRDLGELFNQNHVFLRQIGVSCDEIEQVLTIAKANGAQGGKLTGSGDGGAVILYAPDSMDQVERALNGSEFKTLRVMLG